jgi:hypothetical protein
MTAAPMNSDNRTEIETIMPKPYFSDREYGRPARINEAIPLHVWGRKGVAAPALKGDACPGFTTMPPGKQIPAISSLGPQGHQVSVQ